MSGECSKTTHDKAVLSSVEKHFTVNADRLWFWNADGLVPLQVTNQAHANSECNLATKMFRRWFVNFGHQQPLWLVDEKALRRFVMNRVVMGQPHPTWIYMKFTPFFPFFSSPVIQNTILFPKKLSHESREPRHNGFLMALNCQQREWQDIAIRHTASLSDIRNASSNRTTSIALLRKEKD